jgi:hypothetical protein
MECNEDNCPMDGKELKIYLQECYRWVSGGKTPILCGPIQHTWGDKSSRLFEAQHCIVGKATNSLAKDQLVRTKV